MTLNAHRRLQNVLPALTALGLVLLLSGTAAAQKPMDFSGDEPVNIAAKELSHDEETQLVTAIGDVEIVQGEKILRADKVVYNLGNDSVAAIGNVSLLDETGDIHFAEYVELSGDLKNGFVQGLLSMLADGSRFTAAEARRENGQRLSMTEASYTPCKTCEVNPNPVWAIKADKVVHDEKEKTVKYKNARLEVLGVPLAYTPVFSHADPSVTRKSGFLRPDFGWSDDAGTYFEAGYYFGDIAPDKDATLKIRPTTEAGILVQGQWRQRFEKGHVELNLSGVQSDRREEDGRIEKDRNRAHIFAHGMYELDDKWRAGFNLQKASDKGYLRFYDLSNENVLESDIYAERFSGRNYSRVSAMHFQDVRLGLRPEQAEVLPMAEHRMLGEPGALFGGRWSAGVSGLALHRDDDAQDVQRGSADIGWERRDVLPMGIVTTVNLEGRGDFYSVQNRDAAVVNPALDKDSNVGRGMAIAAVEASYPLVRRIEKAQWLVEPVVSASISPQTDDSSDKFPNEDSIDTQLDTSNLFALSRFTGVDRQEDGARVNYGLRTGFYGDDGRYGKVFLGQSYRFDEDDIFPDGSGLEEKSSDVVGQINLGLSKYLSADYRFQADNRHLRIRRHELEASGGNDVITARVGYFYFDKLPLAGFTESREQLMLDGVLRFNDYWYLNSYILQDLGNEPGLRRGSIGIGYADECFSFALQGTRNLINEASGENGTTIMMRIGLKNIGEFSMPSVRVNKAEDTN